MVSSSSVISFVIGWLQKKRNLGLGKVE